MTFELRTLELSNHEDHLGSSVCVCQIKLTQNITGFCIQQRSTEAKKNIKTVPPVLNFVLVRYDPKQRGSVLVCDFMEKLGFHHEQKLRTRQKLDQNADEQDHKRPASWDSASQETLK